MPRDTTRQVLTCGGGRPPAPGGQTGSMVSFVLVLHWQLGEGLSMVQSGLCRMFKAMGDSSGTSQSVVMLAQGGILLAVEHQLSVSHTLFSS